MKRPPRRGPNPPNFWGDWENEWRRQRGEHPGEPPEHRGQSPADERLHAWREFFFDYTGQWPEQHWAFGGRRFHPWHQGDVSFNPFVANLFSQGGGLLPLIVLHLLVEKPRYGNELMALISQKTSGQWAANPGAIYPLMTELENRGLVEGQWDDPRKRTVRLYQLTALGQRELNRVKAMVRPKLEEAIEVLHSIVSDLDDPTSPSQAEEGDII
ncbi:MAG TPA: PadR family transcriptional regulator [Phototrophicaceae bacterium]|nr:PadR family transcriptional regulator [Phototrophicaceae bacterium]